VVEGEEKVMFLMQLGRELYLYLKERTTQIQESVQEKTPAEHFH